MANLSGQTTEELDLSDLEFSSSTSAFIISSTDLLLSQVNTAATLMPNLVKEQLESFTALSTLIASNERESHHKQVGFSDHLDETDEIDFFSKLRVTRKTFSQLLEIVEEKYNPKYRGGMLPIEPKLCLQLCLWYLGNKTTYREMATLFGMSESGVFKSVQTMIDIICSLGSTYIKWPSGGEVQLVETNFYNMVGFRGVLGIIGCCRIEIKAPEEVQSDFLDWTNKHSVSLLAVCDSEKSFTFIEAGFPGSTHDSEVLQCTQLSHLMINSPGTLFPSNYFHIIGDSAFELSSHILVPFQDYDNVSEANMKYNKKLSQTRCVIDNAFTCLKVRFRRLNYIDADLHRIPSIITACCILHNLAVKNPVEENFLLIESKIVPEIGKLQYVDEPIALPEGVGNLKHNFIAGIL